jgi:hypothetical protein
VDGTIAGMRRIILEKIFTAFFQLGNMEISTL